MIKNNLFGILNKLGGYRIMKIKRFIGGELQSNGYLIYKDGCKDCYLMDTGYNANNFINFVKEEKLNPLGIIFTHHHYDHITAGPKVAKELDCKMYINERDLDRACKTLKDDQYLLESFENNHVFKLGDEELLCINTPGHTKGGICIYSKNSKVAFTGDTVFSEEIGITNLDDGSPEEMANSCAEIIDKWPSDITIYPGHGDSATMKYVKENNEEFKQALAMVKK